MDIMNLCKIISLDFLVVVMGASLVRALSANRTLAQTQMCTVSASVQCFVGSPALQELCADLDSSGPCGKFNLTFDFTYCNVNGDGTTTPKDITIREEAVVAKMGNHVFRKKAFNDYTHIAFGKCHSFERQLQVDSCEGKKSIPASLKFEGWIKGQEGNDGYYCYAWNYLKILLPKLKPSLSPSTTGPNNPTHEPTSKPTCHSPEESSEPTRVVSLEPSAIPSLHPTAKVTNHSSEPSPFPVLRSPIAVHPTPHLPIVNIHTECLVEPEGFLGSGSFHVPCHFVKAPHDPDSSECTRNIKFLFTLDNKSYEQLIVTTLIAGFAGEYDKLTNPFEMLAIPQSGSVVVDYLVTTDICNNTSPIQMFSLVNAIGFDSGDVITESDYYEFLPIKVRMISPVPCFVASVPCNDYIFHSCNRNAGFFNASVMVTLQYVIENIGGTCIDIESASSTIMVDSEQVLDLSLAGINTQFCGEDDLIFFEQRSLDVCSFAGKLIDIFVRLNSGTNSAVNLDACLSFVTVPTLSSTQPVGAPTIYPTSYPTLIPTLPTLIECHDPPRGVWFQFKSRYCHESNTSQFDELGRKGLRRNTKSSSKGGLSTKIKSSCIDYCPVTNPSRVVIASHTGSVLFFDKVVLQSEKFAIAYENLSFNSHFGIVNVHIYNTAAPFVNKNSQSFTIDLSCSKVLYIGEIFGSLELVGFEFHE